MNQQKLTKKEALSLLNEFVDIYQGVGTHVDTVDIYNAVYYLYVKVEQRLDREAK